MPVVPSEYNPPFLFKNSHFSTIYPNLLRKVKAVVQTRKRIELEDGDFIDVDWSFAPDKNDKNLVVLIHGLEGNAQRQYILGLAKNLNDHHWNVAAINLRNCSGQVNRYYRSYNAGVSDDLHEVIHHIINTYSYTNITLCGFSLGGNIALKYLGEKQVLPTEIKAAVGISVPCDLYDSLTAINKSYNYIYQKRFLLNLKHKLYERQKKFPNQISVEDIKACDSLIDIDNLYTSKAHGYKDAMDYYTKCSCLQFLPNIKIPTLLLNAKNDSFLGDKCYPIKEANKNANLFLEIPDYGGHVGFYLPGGTYYHENKVSSFLNTHANTP
ncbi:YheT family hydrolase [Aquimarina sp. RZ0]|uniref:YheT family hydrolase n=1 Tax=Aquimarina sp. RZ0 TaxID=2607730 RepID=UPI0011F209F5|nr:alpha/beta fold hydrolase [Aquimarina sp. RZ0]KAA1247664.1 alpha/beta fold hydrolase [Aquimarina sp. RZ0]